jgi:protocatechuate 3,4-dioxygenase alpha subunit
MTRPPTPHLLTPSQTVGPFFRDGLLRKDDNTLSNVLVRPQTLGERVRIAGRVLDGAGEGIPDALVEIWQANAAGRYHHPADARHAVPLDPAFIGFGRSGTDAGGAFWFDTIKPGQVPLDGERMQAPHIGVIVFARGLLNHLVTRLYFADEPANAVDAVLLRVPPERRHTLVARRDAADGNAVYRFDIILQGAGETVFLNV